MAQLIGLLHVVLTDQVFTFNTPVHRVLCSALGLYWGSKSGVSTLINTNVSEFQL